ncbi:hypothetical protein FACS189481_2750 [Clostridia bacterium]|nr:hypothetical protein FACS189481_2750 [Clostridia bacterium]
MKQKCVKRCSFVLSFVFLVCAVGASSFIASADEQESTEEQKSKQEEFKIDENGLCPELEEEIVRLLNEELTKKKVKGKDGKMAKRKPLKVKSVLTRAARARAKEMFDNEYLGSWRPNGDDWQTIFDEKKYTLKNIKSSSESPNYKYSSGHDVNMPIAEEIVAGLMESSSIPIDDDITHIGVGFYGETENGAYLTFVDVIFVQL